MSPLSIIYIVFLDLKSPQFKSVMALKNVKNKGCFYHALRKKSFNSEAVYHLQALTPIIFPHYCKHKSLLCFNEYAEKLFEEIGRLSNEMFNKNVTYPSL